MKIKCEIKIEFTQIIGVIFNFYNILRCESFNSSLKIFEDISFRNIKELLNVFIFEINTKLFFNIIKYVYNAKLSIYFLFNITNFSIY